LLEAQDDVMEHAHELHLGARAMHWVSDSAEPCMDQTC